MLACHECHSTGTCTIKAGNGCGIDGWFSFLRIINDTTLLAGGFALRCNHRTLTLTSASSISCKGVTYTMVEVSWIEI